MAVKLSTTEPPTTWENCNFWASWLSWNPQLW